MKLVYEILPFVGNMEEAWSGSLEQEKKVSIDDKKWWEIAAICQQILLSRHEMLATKSESDIDEVLKSRLVDTAAINLLFEIAEQEL